MYVERTITRHNIVLTGKTNVKTQTADIVQIIIDVIGVIFLVSGTEATLVVFRSDHMFIFGFGNVDYIKYTFHKINI